MRRHFRREIQFYPAFAMMVGNTRNPAKFCLFWATSCLHDVSNIPIPEFLRCALELVIGRIVGQPEFLCISCRRKLYLQPWFFWGNKPFLGPLAVLTWPLRK